MDTIAFARRARVGLSSSFLPLPRGKRDMFCVLIIVAALSCTTPVITSASAACPVGVSPYSLSRTALSSCGDHLLPRKSTTSLPGGGYQANYVESDGKETSVTVPPPTFNAATASPAERQLYGIPREPPASSPEYPKWKQMVDGPIHFSPAPEDLVEVPPVTRRSTEPSSTASPSSAPATQAPDSASTGFDSRWSGYMDWNGGGCSGICSPTYTESTGYFIEPASNNTTSGCTEVASYTWAGIGGWHSNESTLAQDGTGQQAPNLAADEAFYEVIHPHEGAGGTIATKFHATPGKYFTADTEYTGSNHYSFYMYNYATRTAFHGGASGALWGKTTEFIVERPREHNLYNFKSVTFQGFTNNKPLRQFPDERIDMESGDFVKEQGFLYAATPTNVVNNDEFSDVFHICTKATEKTEEEELEGAGKGGALPRATTEGASEQTGTTAKLGGSVDPEGTYTTYHFEYGTETENYSAATPENGAGEGTSSVPVSATVTGLQPGTTYHYRITANSAEGTAVGVDKTFTTTGTPPPPPPSVTTGGTSSITVHKATVEATVNPNGADTHYYVEYGTNSGLYEQTAPAPPGTDDGAGTTPTTVKTTLSNLAPYEAYYYRVVASNSSGATYGEQKEFRTLSAWTIQSTPEVGSGGTLNGVSCVSTSACTAVGAYQTGEKSTPEAPQALSWNGTSWTSQTTPKEEGAYTSELKAVSCVSTSSCVAVGAYHVKATDKHFGILAESWNGSKWTLETVSLPAGSETGVLYAVSCSASNACTASGFYEESSTKAEYALIERWNGKTWTTQSTPTPPGGEGSKGAPANVGLNGVSCPEAKDCIATGSYERTGSVLREALAEHWNGSTWTITPTPGLTAEDGTTLGKLACVSATSCTAIGSYSESLTTGTPITMHWNGSAWEGPTAKPDPPGTEIATGGFSCYSTSCTETGHYRPEGTETLSSYAEWFSGSTWESSPPIDPAGATWTWMNGVSCTSITVCTSVGQAYRPTGGSYTLVERSNFAAE